MTDSVHDFIKNNSISPYKELIAYETLWARKGATLNRIAKYLANAERPSQAPKELLDFEIEKEIKDFFSKENINFSIMTSESYQYPPDLKDAEYPFKLLYYRGNIDLLSTPKRISIVGTRKASEEGKRRAAKLAKLLVKNGYTIVSGLAEGIDTAAMKAAIEAGGKVIGVIGTPINHYYPKKNKELQEEVARHHLLISHVPIYRYTKESFKTKRYYFPQRNIIMAAVSQATVIVEASDTSGTLTQARGCMKMKRKLFILNSCFEREDIHWPWTYEKKGAIRVREINDILSELEK